MPPKDSLEENKILVIHNSTGVILSNPFKLVVSFIQHFSTKPKDIYASLSVKFPLHNMVLTVLKSKPSMVESPLACTKTRELVANNQYIDWKIYLIEDQIASMITSNIIFGIVDE